MNRHVIYLLVRNDPFAFGELTGMLRRQSRTDFDMVALILGVPDGKLKALLDQRTPIQLTVDERSVAQVITDDIARRKPATVTLLNTAYLPSNTVWFERLIEPLEKGEATVALSRLVHDLYTNWLVQNDFVHLHHRATAGESLAFLYPFSAIAFAPAVLSQWPLPGGSFDDLLLHWGIAEPGPATLVPDALVTHVHPLSPGLFVAAHGRYARAAYTPLGRLGFALRLLVGGITRDFTFSLGRRRPQWMVYSCYFRLRLALGVVRMTIG